MTEEQIIAKIKKLKDIKPRKEWVFLTKKRILSGEAEKIEIESERSSFVLKIKQIFVNISDIRNNLNKLVFGFRFIFRRRAAFIPIISLIILAGLFGFVERSVPGDSLYQVKKISEKSQKFFVSSQVKAKRDLTLANRRLDDLTKIVKKNSTEKLGPGINEYKASVSEIAKNLSQAETGKDKDKIKEIVSGLVDLQKKEEKIKKTYAVVIETKELDSALAQLIKNEIKELKERDLSAKQRESLEKIEESYEKKDYTAALEAILLVENGKAESKDAEN